MANNARKIKVLVNHVSPNSVDIDTEDFTYCAMFNKNISECMVGFQTNDPYHSNEDACEEIKSRLKNIAKEILELEIYLQSFKDASEEV